MPPTASRIDSQTIGAQRDSSLEQQINAVGTQLQSALDSLIEALGPLSGPQALASRLGIDKVLASRVLKAARNNADPMSAIHLFPGPAPARRILQACSKIGLDADVVADCGTAVDAFERLIRETIGDRTALDAIISTYIPEARKEFELRRKQSAFRAMSQLRGAQASQWFSGVFLHPGTEGDKIDVVWINGLFGLERIRPGATVKFNSRRMATGEKMRRPCTLDREPIVEPRDILLAGFCSRPTPQLEFNHVGEVTHYTLGDTGFGPGSGVDVVFSEANFNEIARYVDPALGRKAHVFVENMTPARNLQFDVFVHEDLYPTAPSLRIYDTACEGVADINEPSRDIDQMDLLETIQHLGKGVTKARSSAIRRYNELVREACERLGWDGGAFECYRTQIDYPIHGTQVAMCFDTVAAPGD